MGRYVYGRYDIIHPREIVSNPAIYCDMITSGTTIPILDASFSVLDVQDYVTFFEGFKANSSTGSQSWSGYHFRRSGNQLGIAMNSVPQWFCIITGLTKNPDWPKTGTFNSRDNVMGVRSQMGFNFTGDKILHDWELSLKDFVVSNNPNTYPADGVKGDYYYKLIGSVPQTTSYGITEALAASIKNDAVIEIQEEIKNGNV